MQFGCEPGEAFLSVLSLEGEKIANAVLSVLL